MPPLHNGPTAKYTSISSVNKMVHSSTSILNTFIRTNILKGQTMRLFVCYDLVVIIFFFKTKMISVSDVTVRRGSNSKKKQRDLSNQRSTRPFLTSKHRRN